MKARIAGLLLAGVLVSQADEALTLWYTEPARKWEEALPVGNGFVGAMVFGCGRCLRDVSREASKTTSAGDRGT